MVKFSKTDILTLQQVKVSMWAVEKQHYEMPVLVGFQTMVILNPNGMTFDTVGVFGLVFLLLFKSESSYCGISSPDLQSFIDFP